MKICDCLREDRIRLELTAKNKEEAIQAVARTLEHCDEVVDFRSFVKEVFEREVLQSTGIGGGIAIPHARTDSVSKFVIAIGRMTEAVPFDAVDKKPVRLIVLMGARKAEIGAYLKILARLMRLLRRDEFVQALLDASEPSDVIAAFEEAEA